MPAWDRDVPFKFMGELDLEEEPLGAGPPPPDDAASDGAKIPGPGAVVPYDGGPADGGGDVGGDLGGDAVGDDADGDADADDAPDPVPVPEGVQQPRMSSRERRGVPPLRLIEIMAAASEADDGGAPSTYEEAVSGPEGV